MLKQLIFVATFGLIASVGAVMSAVDPGSQELEAAKLLFEAAKFFGAEQNSKTSDSTTVVDCRLFDPRCSSYIGDLKAGKPHGQGVMTYTSGHSYDGQWVLEKQKTYEHQR